jgi:putative nucleotidyltransferase with HDIG domain
VFNVSVAAKWLWEYDQETFRHSFRVGDLLFKFGRHLMLSSTEMNLLFEIGVYHDLGKMRIPLEILHKPGKLTDKEYRLVQQHTTLGYEMLLPLDLDKRILEVVLYHHENFDGTGYPTGLAGKNIPIFARMTRIVDSYDAMLNHRPYRENKRYDTVVRELEMKAHSFYDPVLLEEFIKMLKTYY